MLTGVALVLPSRYDRLNHELFTAVADMISNTVSPTPRYLSASERNVGSSMVAVDGLCTCYFGSRIMYPTRNAPKPAGPTNASYDSREQDRVECVVCESADHGVDNKE